MSGWVAGVDGAKGGWLAVLARPEGAGVALAWAPRWTDLPLDMVKMVGVDMPIGLAESGPRACDSAARRLLPRERKPSVFAPPRRALLACATWAEANACGRALDGTGIIPKVVDIDLFHRGDFCRQSGARCAAVPDTASDARRRWRQKSPGPSGGAHRPAGCVAALARCPASRRAPRLPGRVDLPHEIGQYQRPLV